MIRICIAVGTCAGAAWGQLSFVDATADLGLDGLSSPHCCFVDLNNDGRADAVIGRNRVFLNVADETAARKLRFVEVENDGLPAFRTGDISVFADLDNDGNKDCVWTRYLDVNADNYAPPTEGPPKTAWLRGNGDGTFGGSFGNPIGTWELIERGGEATTAAVAIGDVDSNGRLDIYLGNWYRKYGADLDGIPNVLLSSGRGSAGNLSWFRDPRTPNVAEPFNDETDPGGRPTYGVAIVRGLVGEIRSARGELAQLLDLNYGRRWNRLWLGVAGRPGWEHDYVWIDVAPDLALDGDPIRHGRYPDWLQERAKTDPRFAREDEKPFRANGNTFDAAVGDIDNDGDFDLFFAEITHAWAGESSDRSRLLVQERDDDGAVRFVSPPELSVDRIPADPTIRSWNQGDLYCELADLDLDGRLDLVLCSSDYPDDQRLRIYRQQTDGTFSDITPWVGIDHVGAQQPSLADIDGDGDLDLIVGQSFNRMRPDQTEGRTPRVRVFLNEAADKSLGNVLVLRLTGDESRGVSRDALGAIVRCTATIRGETVTQSRQLIGIGGHQGKQMDFAVHFGLGDAETAERVEIDWPAREPTTTVLENLGPGTHHVRLGEGDR